MERMTVYRLMYWLSQHPASREVMVSVANVSDPKDITGMDYDEDGPIILEAEEVEIYDEDTEDES